jgi:hypothetical protein
LHLLGELSKLFCGIKMRKMLGYIAAFCSILALGVFGESSQAGTIASGSYPSVGTAGNGTATVITLPPSFFIDSLGKSFTSIGPLDVLFPVTASSSISTYVVTEGITNNTTQTWSDYHELLGSGVDGSFIQGSFASFVLPVDSTYTNAAFTTRAVSPSEIDYSGGAVIPGQAITLTYSIFVPDGPVIPSPNSFSLRQFPTVVPEPSCLALLVIGSTGLLARRRRKPL